MSDTQEHLDKTELTAAQSSRISKLAKTLAALQNIIDPPLTPGLKLSPPAAFGCPTEKVKDEPSLIEPNQGIGNDEYTCTEKNCIVTSGDGVRSTSVQNSSNTNQQQRNFLFQSSIEVSQPVVVNPLSQPVVVNRLLAYMTIDLNNEPLGYEARIAISLGLIFNHQDMSNKRRIEQDIRIEENYLK